tara:strand:- start:164 stop:430 length:267 start_codon:yes stop_codon:yes gene_type:complete
MFRNNELTILSFLTGSAAFYAQQTDQTNLFVGMIIATAILVVCRFRKETVEAQEYLDAYGRDQERNELSERIYRLEEELRDEISEIKG